MRTLYGPRTQEAQELCDASGRVSSEDPLVDFLYVLMRDFVSLGDLADVVNQMIRARRERPECTGVELANGWLAQYAEYVAGQIRDMAP